MTQFNVDDNFVSRYPVQVVGARIHQELWVPAEELDDFNRNIIGRIEVIESHAGSGFEGKLDPETHLPVGWDSE